MSVNGGAMSGKSFIEMKDSDMTISCCHCVPSSKKKAKSKRQKRNNEKAAGKTGEEKGGQVN